MSRRDDRDRDRERASRSQPQASARTNEYFVPKDGIDREVITADICRYLGNDALVRPGTYENPTTRVVQQGYFITAYRNLTTAMIADLKADSERWEAERRQTASRGQPSNVEYRSSTTHQSRQYYGPTEAAPGVAPGYGAQGYQAPASSVQPGVYDSGYQTQAYAQPQPAYNGASQGYATQDNYYVAGADLRVGDPRAEPQARVPSSAANPNIPRNAPVQYGAPQGYAQPDTRSYSSQYSNQPAPSPSYQSSAQNPSDPFYGRAAPVAGGYGDPTSDIYEQRPYQDTGASPYSQAQIPTQSSTAPSGTSRRDRDRDSERDGRHHRSRR